MTAMLRLVSAVWAAAMLVSALHTSTASAQGSERDPEAHGLFLAGQAAYEAGRFDDALRYFQQSYDLSPRPGLLYNIGQAADRARLDAVALDAFRRFLASSPELDAESRRRVEVRVAALEAAIARGEHAAPEGEPEPAPTEPETIDESVPVADPGPVPDPGPNTDPEPAGSGPDAAGLALAITGGVLAIGGGVLIGVGAPDTGALTNPTADETYPHAQSRQDQGTALVVSGIATLGVGAVLGLVGAILLAQSPSPSEHVRLGAGGLEVTF